MAKTSRANTRPRPTSALFWRYVGDEFTRPYNVKLIFYKEAATSADHDTTEKHWQQQPVCLFSGACTERYVACRINRCQWFLGRQLAAPLDMWNVINSLIWRSERRRLFLLFLFFFFLPNRARSDEKASWGLFNQPLIYLSKARL